MAVQYRCFLLRGWGARLRESNCPANLHWRFFVGAWGFEFRVFHVSRFFCETWEFSNCRECNEFIYCIGSLISSWGL